MPRAEVPISVELATCLVREQHPDLADRPIEFVSEGWDNAVFRLGDDLAVRLPRRQINADSVENELRWLPVIAPVLPLPVPAPVREGRPGCGYPWRWMIGPWFEGSTWAESEVVDTRAAAEVLGRFVAALGVAAPPEAPTNPYRGGPLTERDAAFRARLTELEGVIDTDLVTRLWERALGVTPASERRWLHGDLHPANIVVHDGRLAAVIDWVDLAGGDHAYDLAAAWLCFRADRADREAFIAATGVEDSATWERARACALSHALACLTSSADNPRMHSIGEGTLAAVLADSA